MSFHTQNNKDLRMAQRKTSVEESSFIDITRYDTNTRLYQNPFPGGFQNSLIQCNSVPQRN